MGPFKNYVTARGEGGGSQKVLRAIQTELNGTLRDITGASGRERILSKQSIT